MCGMWCGAMVWWCVVRVLHMLIHSCSPPFCSSPSSLRYVVHHTKWVKFAFFMARPLLSNKFYNKLHFTNIEEVSGIVQVDLKLPQLVRDFEGLAAPPAAFFGRGLEDVEASEGVPDIVRQMVGYLDEHGITSEGIFREFQMYLSNTARHETGFERGVPERGVEAGVEAGGGSGDERIGRGWG